MEARPDHLPPQKLRQARAAYRKSGGQARLSEREHRELRRSAELLQRADRIKEAERRKKFNQQKRAEKEQRDREAQKRKFLEDQKKGRIFVGSTQFPRSQYRIEKFISGDEGTVKCIESEEEADPWDEEGIDDTSLLEVLHDCESPIKPSPKPIPSSESHGSLRRTRNDFDFGLSTQDFQAVEFNLSSEVPLRHSQITEQPDKQQDRREMPAPARSHVPLVTAEETLSLSKLGFSSQELDLLALAEFRPSQTIP